MNERGIAGSVGSLDLNLGLDNFKPRRRSRAGSSDARRYGQSYKVAPWKVVRIFLIFGIVRHGKSPL
jgi:hypothetical protein